jgi:diguanylate cyclase (GGDEF)-like protein
MPGGEIRCRSKGLCPPGEGVPAVFSYPPHPGHVNNSAAGPGHQPPHAALILFRNPDVAASSRGKLQVVLATGGLLTGLAALTAVYRRFRQLQARLEQALYAAHHDQLTALPNRDAALTYLATHPVGLVGLLDLDKFKTVNDRYGHHVGDSVLITIAERLQHAINGDGMVARLSGDEFLLLWTVPPAHPLRQATTLLQQICAPATIDGHRVALTASLGLARAGAHLHGPDLIAAADQAMYDAKRTAQHRDAALPQPRARLYPGRYPPEPTDRATTGRRSTRDRPAGLAFRAGEAGDSR